MEQISTKNVEVTTQMGRMTIIKIRLTSPGVPTTVQLVDENKLGCNSIQNLHYY